MSLPAASACIPTAPCAQMSPRREPKKVVYDIRIKLFARIIKFKMSYYDKSSVGRLVTRSVNDMETIASIFSQGLFMIVADLILMLSVLGVMIFLSIELSLIVFVILFDAWSNQQKLA